MAVTLLQMHQLLLKRSIAYNSLMSWKEMQSLLGAEVTVLAVNQELTLKQVNIKQVKYSLISSIATYHLKS